MFSFVRRAFAIAHERRAEQPTLDIGVEQEAISEAIKIIEEHLDREALNRRLRQLAPRDLCPDQKAELVKDLSRLFR